MDCSEKWGEESEVAMDVDVTNQLDTVIEMVHAARRLLTTNTTTDELECFGISEMADQHTFRVRANFLLLSPPPPSSPPSSLLFLLALLT